MTRLNKQHMAGSGPTDALAFPIDGWPAASDISRRPALCRRVERRTTVAGGVGHVSHRCPTVFYLLSLPLNLLLALWIGPGATNIWDLVMPRMRGTASAAYLMVITFVGLALGLYSVGRINVATDFRMMAVGVVLIGLAIRHLSTGESSPRERATRAGEVIDIPAR
jgi:hypothetical protein